MIRVDIPIRPNRVISWRQVVWLASMCQSDLPELYSFELSLACVDAPIQPVSIVFVVYFSPGYSLTGTQSCTFSAISIKTHLSKAD